MIMGKLSVIIPVYNAAKYISACMDSVLNQTYADFEVILIDDGSKDNSYEVCAEIAKKDARIRLFQIENNGVSVARNFGISKARGVYVTFIDADDTVEPTIFESLVENVDEQSLTLCGYFKDYEDKRKPYSEIWDLENSAKRIVTDDFYGLYSKWLLNSVCNKIFVRDFILKSGVCFPRGISIGEDLIFVTEYIRAAKISKFCVINLPLYHYKVRKAESNMTRFDATVIKKLLLQRKNVLDCMTQLSCAESEKTSVNEMFLKEIKQYLFLKFDKKTMETALQDKELLIFIKEFASAAEYENITAKAVYGMRRKARLKHKIGTLKARIKGVR